MIKLMNMSLVFSPMKDNLKLKHICLIPAYGQTSEIYQSFTHLINYLTNNEQILYLRHCLQSLGSKNESVRETVTVN